MKNKAIKGVVFVFLRTILEAISVVFFCLFLNLELSNVIAAVACVLYFFVNILFAIIPHFVVKDISFGFITLFNFLSQIALAAVMLLLLILLMMVDSSDSAGWLGFILIGFYVIIIPIEFIANLVIDLIVYLVTKKQESK